MSIYPTSGRCHSCGHTHPFMGQKMWGQERIWFCAENDHVCSQGLQLIERVPSRYPIEPYRPNRG